MDATQASDCSLIIKAFQKHMMSAPTEEAIIGGLTPPLATIQVNAASAASNLRNLVNPPIPSQVLTAFSSGATAQGADTPSIPSDISNLAAKAVDIKNWQEWLKSCIPCDLRIQFRAEIPNGIDDELLQALEAMLEQFLKELEFILNLLNATDVYGDVCPLLFALQDTCIPDLQRIISLLASILYRMSVRELNSTDLLKLLLIPIFQPIFVNLVGLLNQYKLLITDPLQCVEANLKAQLEKLKIGSEFDQTLANNLTSKANALGLVSGVAQTNQLRQQLNDARQPFQDLDAGINAMQNAAGLAGFHLQRFINVGISEVDTLLDQLKREINQFLGTNGSETVSFLLDQYQKLMIFRLILFIAALVKAFTVGFKCDFNNPAKAQDTISKFLNDFLGPNAPIIVTSDPDGHIQLITNPDLNNTVKNISTTLQPSGNKEVDIAINAIITQSSQPVTIKPTCVFEPSSTDANKLAQWIKELDATGV